MIILKITLWIVIIAAVVGIVAVIADLFGKKNDHKSYGLYERFIKRGLDAFLATGALIVLSPVLLVTAVMVRVKLGAPVLFTQDRPGRDGKIFKLYKFRTMTDQKDEQGNLMPDEIRLTSFGKKLCATSLDELQELLNIIKGDMAVVGPRPLLVKYLPRYTEEQHRRHEVRPGLTGYAQAHGRNAVTWEGKFKMDVWYDVWYVDHVSFSTDAGVFVETIRSVIKREGISGGGEATMSEFMGTENSK